VRVDHRRFLIQITVRSPPGFQYPNIHRATRSMAHSTIHASTRWPCRRTPSSGKSFSRSGCTSVRRRPKDSPSTRCKLRCQFVPNSRRVGKLAAIRDVQRLSRSAVNHSRYGPYGRYGCIALSDGRERQVAKVWMTIGSCHGCGRGTPLRATSSLRWRLL
jgi:hypothetical protein